MKLDYLPVDPRVEDWLFMSSPLPTLFICLSYVAIVKKIGPELMKSRAPFDLRTTLVLYNGFQVLFSAWLFYEVQSYLMSYPLFHLSTITCSKF